MTLEPISKREMLYVKLKYKDAVFHITNKEHIRGKNRYLEINQLSLKYLNEFREKEKAKITERYGWFTEDYIDKYGHKKTHEVFINEKK